MTASRTSPPRVRVVVVNYEGGELTMTCLRSVLDTQWPAEQLEVVLVDNDSRDGIADRVERELTGVRVVRTRENLGFAGGCNRGLRDLGEVDFVALVNNDATVDPGWLEPLVDALEGDPQLGAACPKILLDGRFREVTLRTPTRRRGRLDRREVGAWVSGARVDGVEVWARTKLVRGFWGPEPPPRRCPGPGEWTTGEAVALVPEGARAELRVGTDWVDVPFTSDAHDIVNNVGNVLTDDWSGADRGYLEPDRGQYDSPEEVFAWCGAGVLLRRAYLDEVGHFDEDLFLYYEDFELSLRGRAHGWRYRYVPESVVRHVHMAASAEGSELRDHYNERNRLLVLLRHGPKGGFRRALWRHMLATGSYARRDLVSRALHFQLPQGTIVWRRIRAELFALTQVGVTLSKRRQDRRRRRQKSARAGFGVTTVE